MDTTISAWGALFGLLLAIILIIRKVHPVYALMAGAFFGGLVGQCSTSGTVSYMLEGAAGIMPATLRVISAGVLAGALIESGAARKIAETLLSSVGQSRVLFALAFATMILTMVGVFVDVAVITVAPIAIAVGWRADLSRSAVLFAMIGGGKAGNIMSPNPNTIILSENFDIPLTNLMLAGILPAIGGVVVTCLLARWLGHRGSRLTQEELGEAQARNEKSSQQEVSFCAAISGPVVAIVLLALRPTVGIQIDPLVALPLGGVAGLLFMGKIRSINHCASAGLAKMAPVALLLIGTGCLAGIIGHSDLKDWVTQLIHSCGVPTVALAPLSGILMSGATASTVAGSTVASSVFGTTLLGAGVAPLAAAVMIHTGATVCDTLPHGSFFHASGGSVQMAMGERLKLIPYEATVGLVHTVIATVVFGIFHLWS